jgi:NADH-quinone oxidoreductase subunit C
MANEISLDTVLTKIAAETGCECQLDNKINNEESIHIPVDQLHAVIGVLRDHFDCYHLSTITAQQRESQLDQIELIYHFWQGKGFSLILTLPLDSPQVESIISLIPGADFYEREAAEMYGVTFSGRDKTPPLLLPDDWNQDPPFIQKEVSDE